MISGMLESSISEISTSIDPCSFATPRTKMTAMMPVMTTMGQIEGGSVAMVAAAMAIPMTATMKPALTIESGIGRR
ncbi:hypothetical protein EMPG_16828 [Blastomyces silverae]|uniref:Uncharacterized protein n=1 Tax=Blastomyces silverae TaxID=2060906 RepID=A0A0H1B8A9_9EURO|nr:hypothetical protein EMPG_16828 [Blastomyces silverae]